MILRTAQALLLAVISLDIGSAAADENPASELLRTHGYEVVLDQNGITGPGAELIIAAAADAQFVALGEEHHSAYIPAITTALFAELSERYGYGYFMTEQDPVMMEVLSRPPARGYLDAIRALAERYPMGVTFNSDEELAMLADIGQLSSARYEPVWGCDQAFGVTHVLDQLLEEPLGSDAQKALVMQKREAAAAIERDRDFKTSHFISNSEPSWYAELDAEVGPEAGSRAAWLIDIVVQSNRIYDFYRRGEAGEVPGFYENNRYREEHLKDLCLAKYRDAERIDPSPKALMKFGSWHLYQGLSPTRIHTIGDFFANVARFNGHDFLSVNFVSMPANADSYSSETGYAWPFIKDLDRTRFRVIDLRPFRHYRNRTELEKAAGDAWRDEYKQDFVRLVYGYDLLFFIGETKSATFSVVPQVE